MLVDEDAEPMRAGDGSKEDIVIGEEMGIECVELDEEELGVTEAKADDDGLTRIASSDVSNASRRKTALGLLPMDKVTE